MSADAARQAVTVARSTGVYTGTALALNSVLATAVTLAAGWMALRGQISVGQLVTAVGLAQFVIEPLKLGSEMPKFVMTAHASAQRLALVLAAPPSTTPGTRPVDPRPDGGELELDGVRHASLRGVSFRVSAGSFVAIVARDPRAGADLAAVLAAVVPPDGHGGCVRLNGRPVAELAVESLRASLLVNPAHSEVFAGTLRTNIDPSGTSALIDEAVAASMLSDVVALHDAGLDHAVRDRGANLSGGQRQRLTLARALAADPDVLVLHDPTTAVDAVTEQLVAERVAALRAGRTTIVVTTSPPLLDVADRVLVLDDGVVAAAGRHRDLLAGDDAYRLAVAR